MKKAHVLVAALALTVVVAGCSSSSGSGKVAVTVDIKATDMAFDPATVTIKKGETARFVLKNDGAQEHDFTVDKAKGKAAVVNEGGSHGAGHSKSSLHVSAAPGKSGTVDFTPSETGSYEFYCTVPGHKDAGMKGTLVVN